MVKLSDNVHRSCCHAADGFKSVANCPYVGKNKYGTWICTIDGVVQVEFYGCVPSRIEDFQARKARALFNKNLI